jgi:phage antirepressor YoqD-like protein
MGQTMMAGKGCGGVARPGFQQVAGVTRNAVTMSSREIAELTGKEHFHVKRDIEVMLRELGKDASSFGGIYLDSMNRKQAEYHLDRELTETLITGYSIKLRHRVIQRLHQLEQQQGGRAVPGSLPEALRLAADLAERNAGLQLLVTEQAPKVAALDRLCDADGSMCMTDAAKHLGMQPKALMAQLQARRWVYQRPNSRRWLAYQPRLQSGYLVHKVSVIGRDEAGDDRLASQVRVTAKGLAKLAQLLGVEVQG